MKARLLIFMSCIGIVGCTPEFIPNEVTEKDESAFILPTGNENGRKGELQASFLSSQRKYTTSSNTLDDFSFRVSFVTTAQNFDIFKWEFEGGTVTTGMASTTNVSGTAVVEGTLEELNAETEIGLLVNYDNGFGRYDVTHGVANSDQANVNYQKDYVTYEYLDNMQVAFYDPTNDCQLSPNTLMNAIWDNREKGWYGPQSNTATNTMTYAPCEDAMIGFYQSCDGREDSVLSISKEFRNFGTQPKNLIFEYKFDFLVQPPSNDLFPKIALNYAPLISQSTSETIEIESTELWREENNEQSEFRQVVVPLPLIRDFQLSFIKYPSELNQNGLQRYPFIACIREIKIIPRGGD